MSTMKKTAYYVEMDSPIGPLVLCAEDQGLCHIDFGTFADREVFLRSWFQNKAGVENLSLGPEILQPAIRQLEEYFQGRRRSFELPLVFYGTPFQKKVWAALADVPFGETRSYKQIGEAVGAPRAVRAVGGANNKNPLPVIIPCHRIIGANGSMVGYGGGLAIKEYLLKMESPETGKKAVKL